MCNVRGKLPRAGSPTHSCHVPVHIGMPAAYPPPGELAILANQRLVCKLPASRLTLAWSIKDLQVPISKGPTQAIGSVCALDARAPRLFGETWAVNAPANKAGSQTISCRDNRFAASSQRGRAGPVHARPNALCSTLHQRKFHSRALARCWEFWPIRHIEAADRPTERRENNLTAPSISERDIVFNVRDEPHQPAQSFATA